MVISHVPRASFIPNKTRLKTDKERERERERERKRTEKESQSGEEESSRDIFISRRLNPLREVSCMYARARVPGHYENPQPGGFRWLMDGLENP